MPLNEFLQELEKQTAQAVKHIEASEKDTLKRAYSCALALSDANTKLKTFIAGYEFADEREEIDFFKQQKPALISQLVYYCEVYNIEASRPVGGVEIQHDYLSRELERLQDYIDRCPEFYRYYRLGLTDSDAYYFTRGAFEIGRQYLEASAGERDPRYSSNRDYKLAKIQAIERLEILLKSELDELERPPQEAPQLAWAAKKAFLIELIYAADSFRLFGKTPLVRLVEKAQRDFGIDLGNVSSIFAEMKTRNDPTPCLDGMKEALLRRMKR